MVGITILKKSQALPKFSLNLVPYKQLLTSKTSVNLCYVHVLKDLRGWGEFQKMVTKPRGGGKGESYADQLL